MALQCTVGWCCSLSHLQHRENVACLEKSEEIMGKIKLLKKNKERKVKLNDTKELCMCSVCVHLREKASAL